MKQYINIRVTKIVYLIVFLSLAFWSIFAYITINDLIEEQKVYAKLINITGKQRMLSQKTTLFAKRSFESNNENIKNHFKELVDLMKSDYIFILNNLTSREIEDIYFKAPNNLDEKVKKYFLLLEDFEKNPNLEVLKQIEDRSFKLLPVLNHAVYKFEAEINLKVQELQEREVFILIAALLTLALEALFIVVPSVKATEKSLEILKKSNENLEYRVNRELERAKKRDELLYHQSKMLTVSKLIDNMAHYWRQPLSVITTSASGILVKKEFNQLNDNDLVSSLNSIVDNSTYLSATIEKYRSLFELKKDRNHFFMNSLYNKSIDIISNKTQEHNIKLIENIEKINFYGYESDMIQILIYIYDNAKDIFIKRETKNKLIFTDIFKKDNSVVISIKDTAGGIEEDLISNIFDPYFTTKEKNPATGIDLYISKQILKDRFQGEIEVKNSSFEYEGVLYTGANFVIRLPIKIDFT